MSKNKPTTQAVAPVAPQGLALQEYDVRGKEDALDEKDRIYPMLKLVQKMSPQEDMDAGRPGEFINSLTKENYGAVLTLVPILTRKQRVKWIDRKQGGGMECRSYDGRTGSKYGSCGECEFGKWKTVEEEPDAHKRKPACTEYFAFPCLVLRGEQEPDLVVASFGMTKYTAGKKLANLIHLKPVAAFAGQYGLRSVLEKGAEGDYYGVDINGAGLLKPDDAIYQTAESWWKRLSHADLKTDETV